MSDYVTLDPQSFTDDELLSAARGETTYLNPQLAVTLLRAKLGPSAEQPLVELAIDETVDQRVRQAAVLELAGYARARDVLTELARSPNDIVAAAAAQALR
ncbi:MAG TPA: HEAT repeat domain-containing protein [Dehalococcoidia bacterium]